MGALTVDLEGEIGGWRCLRKSILFFGGIATIRTD
jgi:hypothetical protein